MPAAPLLFTLNKSAKMPSGIPAHSWFSCDVIATHGLAASHHALHGHGSDAADNRLGKGIIH
jgi:hypothetical protein